MKVLCIAQHKYWGDVQAGIYGPGPSFGDIDIVTETVVVPERGAFHYLERFGNKNAFNAKEFTIIPDEPAEIEEAEFEVLEPATA